MDAEIQIALCLSRGVSYGVLRRAERAGEDWVCNRQSQVHTCA